MEKIIAGFQLGGHRPDWFDSWISKKQTKPLRDGTLLRYLDDLRVFAFDPATMSLQKIQARLAMLGKGMAVCEKQKSSSRNKVDETRFHIP